MKRFKAVPKRFKPVPSGSETVLSDLWLLIWQIERLDDAIIIIRDDTSRRGACELD